MNKTRQSGFTLIELMITLAVAGIIMAIAYPSFQGQMRKGRRAQGISTMQELQLQQEQWRTNNTAYGSLADLGGDASDEYYTYSIDNVSGTKYTITATPHGDQVNDTACAPMTIDEGNNRLPVVCF